MEFDKIFFIRAFMLVALLWFALTFIVQSVGFKDVNQQYSSSNHLSTALVVYDADPFYNFDEQICRAFAQGLANGEWSVDVISVSNVDENAKSTYDLYVVCANTYNFSPDIVISEYIDRNNDLAGKPVVAITLGSGSTERAQKIHESNLKGKGAEIIFSESYWLMRPNDEARMSKSNVAVAVEQAEELGRKTAQWFNQQYSFE